MVQVSSKQLCRWVVAPLGVAQVERPRGLSLQDASWMLDELGSHWLSLLCQSPCMVNKMVLEKPSVVPISRPYLCLQESQVKDCQKLELSTSFSIFLSQSLMTRINVNGEEPKGKSRLSMDPVGQCRLDPYGI